MKASKLREMSIDELSDEREALKKQLFQLRLQKATGQLDNFGKIREAKRDLARTLTIATEKERE